MITKKEWEYIKSYLSGRRGSIEFELGKDKITVNKTQLNENKLGITVYFNENIDWNWGVKGDTFNSIVEKIWMKRTKSIHTAKRKKELIKELGKRAAIKHFGLDDKFTVYTPIFSSYTTLERQFKKIESLKLVTKFDEEGMIL